MKVSIYVATIEHKHGTNFYLATKEEELDDQIAAFVGVWAKQELSEDKAAVVYEHLGKGENEAAIGLYFDVLNEIGTEFLTRFPVQTLNIDETPRKTSLNALLEDWFVDAPGTWENNTVPQGWWAVSNDDEGIVAYFMREEDAFRFRLAEINRILNG